MKSGRKIRSLLSTARIMINVMYILIALSIIIDWQNLQNLNSGPGVDGTFLGILISAMRTPMFFATVLIILQVGMEILARYYFSEDTEEDSQNNNQKNEEYK